MCPSQGCQFAKAVRWATRCFTGHDDIGVHHGPVLMNGICNRVIVSMRDAVDVQESRERQSKGEEEAREGKKVVFKM